MLAYLMIMWTSCQQNLFQHLNINFSDEDITNDAVPHHTPLENFWRFVSEDMIKALTSNTNK